MIISIGIQCTVAYFKKPLFNENYTLPFDWMFTNPKFIFEMLELLLDRNIEIEDLVKNHFFFCSKKADMKNLEHYYTSDNGFALYNTKYNVIFPHDKYNDETIAKYVRRFKRLKNLILKTDEYIYFVYSSQSSLESGNFTIDNNIVIKDVYFYLSKINRLINKFRQNYKIVVFDSILEEKEELLEKNITLCKLNKCNNWGEIVTQLENYKYIFKK